MGEGKTAQGVLPVWSAAQQLEFGVRCRHPRCYLDSLTRVGKSVTTESKKSPSPALTRAIYSEGMGMLGK